MQLLGKGWPAPANSAIQKWSAYCNLAKRTGRLRVFPGYMHAATYKTVAPRKAIAATGGRLYGSNEKYVEEQGRHTGGAG